MKVNSLVLILFIFIFATACKKTEEDPGINFNALKNGNKWIPTYSSATLSILDNKMMIHCLKRVSKNYEDELFNLYFNLKDTSEQMIIYNFYSSWHFVIGGDGISDTYSIVEDPDNIIQITSLDTTNKQISGNFKVKLLRDKFYQHPEDTMFFTEGYFNLKYLEAYMVSSMSNTCPGITRTSH